MKQSFLISGAGTGIGRAVAISIANQSPDNEVILLGRTRKTLEETRHLLPDPEVHPIVVVDTSDSKALSQAFSDLKLIKRNLKAIVANAGIGGNNQYGPDDRWDEIIDTNLSGTYRLVNEALPALESRQSEYGHIVVISSILARLGVPGYSAYCASKAGLLGLMRSWATEFSSKKILVNAICPGWVETEMATSGIKAFASGANIPYESAFEKQMESVPLGKMAKPDEIAELVQFLILSNQLSITGQSLDMNNGALMP